MAEPEIVRHALPPAVGRALRDARRARGWSLRQAEENLDISFGFLAALERGERAPGGASAARLIRGLMPDDDTAGILQAVAEQVDRGRRDREEARGRPNRVRRPRGHRAERQGVRQRTQERYAADQRQRAEIRLMIALLVRRRPERFGPAARRR